MQEDQIKTNAQEEKGSNQSNKSFLEKNVSRAKNARNAWRLIKTTQKTYSTIQAAQSLVAGLSPAVWGVIGVFVALFVTTLLLTILGGGGGGATTQQPADSSQNNPPSNLPKILTFNGGYAYLSCSSNSRTNCPVLDNKTGNLNITVYAFVFADKSKIKFDPTKAWVYITINTAFFSSLTKNSTTPPYDSLSSGGIISAKNQFRYGWKLSTLQKGPGNSYLISISDKIAPGIKNGTTTVSLKLSGFGDVTASDGTDTTEGDLYAGMDSPPSDKTCNKYGGIMNIIEVDTKLSPFKEQLKPANFGDPECTYTPKKFKQVIADTLNKPVTDSMVDFWSDLADCESGSPNGHDAGNHNSSGNCAALGTWGRFQMCSNNPPGQPWKKLSYRGDVTWQRQIQNAIWTNKQQDNSFEYWGTARCMCATKKYKDQPVCAKLWEKQRACEKNNKPSSCSYIRYNCNNSCPAISGR